MRPDEALRQSREAAIEGIISRTLEFAGIKVTDEDINAEGMYL